MSEPREHGPFAGRLFVRLSAPAPEEGGERE